MGWGGGWGGGVREQGRNLYHFYSGTLAITCVSDKVCLHCNVEIHSYRCYGA